MHNHAEENRKHFDNLASSYDSKPWAQAVCHRLTKEMQERHAWFGVDWVNSDISASNSQEDGNASKDVRILDYACGPGIVSMALLQYATTFIGIDISSGMVAEYNSRAAKLKLPPTKTMSATTGDLFAVSPSAEFSQPSFYDFDLAAVGAAFHHFDDPDLAARRLVERLKPHKGILLITDFVSNNTDHHTGHHSSNLSEDKELDATMAKEFVFGNPGPNSEKLLGDEQFAKAMKTVKTHGFTKERVEKLFKKAGCVDIEVVVLDEPITFGDENGGVKRQMFMAKGRRE